MPESSMSMNRLRIRLDDLRRMLNAWQQYCLKSGARQNWNERHDQADDEIQTKIKQRTSISSRFSATHGVDHLATELEGGLKQLGVSAENKAEINVHQMTGRGQHQVLQVTIADTEDIGDHTIASCEIKQTIEKPTCMVEERERERKRGESKNVKCKHNCKLHHNNNKSSNINITSSTMATPYHTT